MVVLLLQSRTCISGRDAKWGTFELCARTGGSGERRLSLRGDPSKKSATVMTTDAAIPLELTDERTSRFSKVWDKLEGSSETPRGDRASFRRPGRHGNRTNRALLRRPRSAVCFKHSLDEPRDGALVAWQVPRTASMPQFDFMLQARHVLAARVIRTTDTSRTPAELTAVRVEGAIRASTSTSTAGSCSTGCGKGVQPDDQPGRCSSSALGTRGAKAGTRQPCRRTGRGDMYRRSQS